MPSPGEPPLGTSRSHPWAAGHALSWLSPVRHEQHGPRKSAKAQIRVTARSDHHPKAPRTTFESANSFPSYWQKSAPLRDRLPKNRSLACSSSLETPPDVSSGIEAALNTIHSRLPGSLDRTKTDNVTAVLVLLLKVPLAIFQHFR